MKTALIGYTGFVGGNLHSRLPFTDLFNSKNIDSIRGQSFDYVVCAGVRAEKWKANQNPQADWESIEQLIGSLDQMRTKELILISTVDVYPDPRHVDENTEINADQAMAYGRHRRMLEEWAAKKFPTRIIRLPGLFGDGLKKNVIFDFLHNNQLEKIHADMQLQFYGLDRLASDIEILRAADLWLFNAVTEPVTVREIARAVFGKDFQNQTPGTPPRYDVCTKHAPLFGGKGPYLQSSAQVLAELKRFVDRARTVK